jgi:hypothetical protein
MARIAVLIDDAFEDSEYSQPAEEFRRAGHTLVHLGLTRGATVKGKKSGTAVTIDAPIAGAGVDPYDARFIPGGYSPGLRGGGAEPTRDEGRGLTEPTGRFAALGPTGRCRECTSPAGGSRGAGWR